MRGYANTAQTAPWCRATTPPAPLRIFRYACWGPVSFLQVWLFFESAFEIRLCCAHALTGRCVTPSLLPPVNPALICSRVCTLLYISAAFVQAGRPPALICRRACTFLYISAALVQGCRHPALIFRMVYTLLYISVALVEGSTPRALATLVHGSTPRALICRRVCALLYISPAFTLLHISAGGLHPCKSAALIYRRVHTLLHISEGAVVPYTNSALMYRRVQTLLHIGARGAPVLEHGIVSLLLTVDGVMNMGAINQECGVAWAGTLH